MCWGTETKKETKKERKKQTCWKLKGRALHWPNLHHRCGKLLLESLGKIMPKAQKIILVPPVTSRKKSGSPFETMKKKLVPQQPIQKNSGPPTIPIFLAPCTKFFLASSSPSHLFCFHTKFCASWTFFYWKLLRVTKGGEFIWSVPGKRWKRRTFCLFTTQQRHFHGRSC